MPGSKTKKVGRDSPEHHGTHERDLPGQDMPRDSAPLKEDAPESIITKNYITEEKESIPVEYESITAFRDEGLPDPRNELTEAYEGKSGRKRRNALQ